MKLRLLTLAVLSLVLSPTANAFVELKVGYSILNSDPKSYNAFNALVEPAKDLNGFTADLLLNSAIMPINIGARYEKWAVKKDGGITSSEVTFDRISVILNKRFIDTVAYLGMVATVGVSNEFKDALNRKASSSLSGSIGLEGGMKFGFLMAGVEGGYLIAPLGDLKNSAGTTITNAGAPVKVDMSGVYARAMVGFNF